MKEHPDLTGALIYDWLQEGHGVHDVSENTIHNYVHELREAYHIPKVQQQRVYTAVPETPKGFQVQVDFGQEVLLTKNGERKRVYFIAFILSHSRYKYIDCLDRPFRTMDVVRCHENAFDLFGGIPEEMVYDQMR